MAALLATLLFVGGSVLLTPSAAQAAISSPFSQVFTANTAGDIVLRGNALLTCPSGAAGCEAARAGAGSEGVG
jgi:hypothetical protein